MSCYVLLLLAAWHGRSISTPKLQLQLSPQRPFLFCYLLLRLLDAFSSGGATCATSSNYPGAIFNCRCWWPGAVGAFCNYPGAFFMSSCLHAEFPWISSVRVMKVRWERCRHHWVNSQRRSRNAHWTGMHVYMWWHVFVTCLMFPPKSPNSTNTKQPNTEIPVGSCWLENSIHFLTMFTIVHHFSPSFTQDVHSSSPGLSRSRTRLRGRPKRRRQRLRRHAAVPG